MNKFKKLLETTLSNMELDKSSSNEKKEINLSDLSITSFNLRGNKDILLERKFDHSKIKLLKGFRNKEAITRYYSDIC